MDGSLLVLLVMSGLLRATSAVYREYHFINARMSWPEAQSYCRERFTDLATVDSMDDVNRLMNSVGPGYSGSVWIGLKKGTEKCWGWSYGDDTLAQFSAWSDGHPTSANECGYLAYGVWFSSQCSDVIFSACHSVSTGYIQVDLWMNWTEAQSYCREHYTDLATIRNAEELNQINSVVSPNAWLWIGLFQDSWDWSDKWSWSFRHWEADQPSQSSGSGDCVGMSRNNSGKWSQYSCDLQQPFMCYGDEKLKIQIVHIKLSCKDKCMLDDASLQTAFVNVLKSMGLKIFNKVSWITSKDEEVYHPKSNYPCNQ